jgi:uncharacterized protein YkuJ
MKLGHLTNKEPVLEEIETLIRVIQNLQAMQKDTSIECKARTCDFNLSSPNKTSEVNYKTDSNRFIAAAIQELLPSIFGRAAELAQAEIEEGLGNIEARVINLKMRADMLS